MPKLHPALLLLATALQGLGQQSITEVRVPVTQNFDAALGTSTAAILPTGWRRGEVWTSGDTTLTQAAGTTGTGIVAGGSNGGAYNWANGVTATATDRAPGFLSTGGLLGFGSPCYLGYAFTNNTGATLHALNLSWNYEKYRSGSRAFTWTFEHGGSPAAITAAADGAQSYAANANNTTISNPPASVAKSFQISGLSIAPGATYYLRWTYTGLDGSSNAQGLGLDDFSVTTIGPALTAPAPLAAFTANYGSASATQDLTVAAADLTGAVTITAPAGFEISADAGTFASTLELAASSLPATISARIAADTASGSVSGNLTIASPGASSRSVALSGTVVPPSLSPSVTTLSGFSSSYGTASAAQTLDLSASHPAGLVTVTASAGFEISSDGLSYAASLSIPAASFPSPTTTVPLHVRLTAGAQGGIVSGALAFSSTAAAARSVALSGTVQGVLAASVSNLSGLTAISGAPSAPTTVSLTGGGLTDSLTVTAPTGYEVSTDGVTYTSSLTVQNRRVTSISSTSEAFAALRSDGSVVTWGTGDGAFTPGGPMTVQLEPKLASGVTSIVGNHNAFAALKTDGSVVAWGNAANGGSTANAWLTGGVASGVTSVIGNGLAFAALKSNGSVVVWGNQLNGGSAAIQIQGGVAGTVQDLLTSGVARLSAVRDLQATFGFNPPSTGSFIAVKGDGSVVAWGGNWGYPYGANFGNDVRDVIRNRFAQAALKNNGSILLAADTDFGGSYQGSTAITSVNQAIVSTEYGFGALRADGTAYSWGLGGHSVSQVASLHANYGSYAALKQDGSVVCWGDPASGGGVSPAVRATNVATVYAHPAGAAFAAVRTDGSVVTWGESARGGDSSSVSAQLASGVVRVYSNSYAFAALKADGSVVTWGMASRGGNSSSADLSSGVVAIYSNDWAFAALKSNGTVVTWGDEYRGGNPAALSNTYAPLALAPASVNLPLTLYVRLAAGTAPGPITGNLTLSSQGVDTTSLALSGQIQPPPSITPSVATLGGFSAPYQSPSEAQTMVISGSQLIGDVTVTASARYQVSLDGDLYAASLTLPAATLPATIHVRLGASSTTGTASGVLTLASPSANEQTVELSGNVPTPTVTPSVLALEGLDSTHGLPSEAQRLTLSGSSLVGPVLITAPATFEISSDGNAYFSELSLPVTSLPATVHVRLRGTANVASHTANLTMTSLGAGTSSVVLIGEMLASLTSSSSQLTGFTATGGQTSSGQTITVNGSGLKGAVTITAPAGFEVSRDGVNFVSSLEINRRVVTIKSNPEAMAALRSDGSVVTWGSAGSGGDSSAVSDQLSSGVAAIYSNSNAFAALKTNGSVVTWGATSYGGNSSSVSAKLASGVTAIYSTDTAFAALKNDGSVVTWGLSDSGGNSSSVALQLASGVTSIQSTYCSFAAIKDNGSVVTWGGGALAFGPGGALVNSGADSSSVASRLSSNVISISSAIYSFAALKSDGSVVTWGGDGLSFNAGGDSSAVAPEILSEVTSIHATEFAYAALKSNGSVVTWGWSAAGGDSSAVSSALQSGVVRIFATKAAFAALKNDGSVITWGSGAAGGDSSAVAGDLTSGIQMIYATGSAFAAVKLTPGQLTPSRIITWGQPTQGGDASYLFGSPRLEKSIFDPSYYNGLYNHATSIVATQSLFFAKSPFYGDKYFGWGSLDSDFHPNIVTPDASLYDVSHTAIFGDYAAFAVLRADGSVVTFGSVEDGGDSSAVAEELAPGAPDLPLTLHVRLAADASGGPVSGNLTIYSPSAQTPTVALSGTVSGVINSSEFALSGFTANLGSPSASQTLTVSGARLSGPLALTAPDNYEISADGVTYGASLQLGVKVSKIASTTTAFAALKNNGSVVTWGNLNSGGDSSSVAAQLGAGVSSLFANDYAFAALRSDGSVVTWGGASFGGDSSSVTPQLASGVTAVYSNTVAFAALKSDGSVVTWGDPDKGDGSSTVAPLIGSGVVSVAGSEYAFAALKADGSVVSWGDPSYGGDSSTVASKLASGVVSITSNRAGFAALTADGSAISWGASYLSSIPSSLADRLGSGVTAIYASQYAFAAVKSDGSVVTWGFGGGHDSSAVASRLSSGVVAVYSNWYSDSFAALKSNGSVVTWGDPETGGNSTAVSSRLSSGVTGIYSTVNAFAAVKGDGSVVTWGGSFGGDSSAVSSQLASGVSSITANNYAFAARKQDGSVVTWGVAPLGGDSSTVSSELNSGVVEITSTIIAFAARKQDGTIVTWGNTAGGANASTVASQLAPQHPLPANVYIRLAANAQAGAAVGNLTLASEGVPPQTVALSGTVNSTVSHTHQELWRFTNFGSYASESNGADNADPDSDGLSNLQEYALGLNPNTSNVLPASLALNGANLEYTYNRSSEARDNGVTYQIEWSDTLEAGSWSTETVTQQIISTQGALQTVKASIPKGATGKRFLRLKVEAAPGN